MHPNPAFRTESADRNLAFARERGFGTLTINGDAGPLASHVPFLLAADGTSAELHLVRSNPIARVLTAPRPALLAISGPDSYVSPDWYQIDDQVPTWNYVAVHLRGRLELLPSDLLRGHLDRLAAAFETRLLPKQPWLADKMPPDVLDRFMRMILPCRLTVEDVQGTWKLNQNKPEAARRAAADGIETAAIGQELAQLARLMRTVET
jgi:transcriptional regulator